MSVYVDIQKDFGTFKLDVKFEAADETLALLGASGCGKSMTLKCIAGIERPDSGRIVVDDTVLFDSDKKINLTPQERRTGLLFQNYALFPNMTVLQNIQAGAKREKDKKKQKSEVQRIMDSFGIAELADRYPDQLSGGQQQRVALARILVSSPRILLLDEPFSALDSHLRFNLEQEVRKVIHDFGKTVIMVSHDRDEVFRMADSIAIINDGIAEACGTKTEVFKNPKTKTGAILTGCKNISRAENRGDGRIYASDWDIELLSAADFSDAEYVGLRMHGISNGNGENTFRCKVIDEIENPFTYIVMLRPLCSNTQSTISWEVDKAQWQAIRTPEIDVHFPKDSLLPLK